MLLRIPSRSQPRTFSVLPPNEPFRERTEKKRRKETEKGKANISIVLKGMATTPPVLASEEQEDPSGVDGAVTGASGPLNVCRMLFESFDRSIFRTSVPKEEEEIKRAD